MLCVNKALCIATQIFVGYRYCNIDKSIVVITTDDQIIAARRRAREGWRNVNCFRDIGKLKKKVKGHWRMKLLYAWLTSFDWEAKSRTPYSIIILLRLAYKALLHWRCPAAVLTIIGFSLDDGFLYLTKYFYQVSVIAFNQMLNRSLDILQCAYRCFFFLLFCCFCLQVSLFKAALYVSLLTNELGWLVFF